MKKDNKSYVVNVVLLLSAFFSMFSGLLIQIQYHMGNHGNAMDNARVLGFNYFSWSIIHKFSIVILSVFTVFHIYFHWKWYKKVIAKRLLIKHKQVITLTVIFILVAITGFIPWIIDLLEGNQIIRKTFIEVHDKMAIILFIYFILHISKRLKWYLSASPREHLR